MNRALFVTLFGRSLAQQIAAMYRNGGVGPWYDPTDISTLFQDAAGTTPVTASGDPVRLMRDKSGMGWHATAQSDAARPVYTVSGTQRFLACNGTSSAMQTSAITLSGTDKLSIALGIYKASDAGIGAVAELGATPSIPLSGGSFWIQAPSNPGEKGYWFGLAQNGVDRTGFVATTFEAPITNILDVRYDFAGADRTTEVIPKVNGATPTLTGALTTNAGSGNFGNYVLYLFARAGTSLFFNGNFYGAVFNARPSGATTAELVAMRRYVNLNTRVTLT